MFTRTEDGSVVDSNGKIMFFSVKRFVSDIALGNKCFICGADPSTATFNNEHVLPRWILKKYNLYGKRITLPNESAFSYDKYVIPCCEDCNSTMNRVIEQPIQRVLAQGYKQVTQYFKANGPWMFFVWLALIYLKTHLKDKSLLLYQDSRKSNHHISDIYTWEELHHIHCLARSFYTNIALDGSVFGSMLLLPAKMKPHFEKFDYVDLHFPRTILLRLDDTAFISVLNDSCAASNLCSGLIEQGLGPLSPIQLRELLARLAFANVILNERPEYYSEVDMVKEEIKMSGRLADKLTVGEHNDGEFGALMDRCCGSFLPDKDQPSTIAARENMIKGKWTFLHDAQGNFIENSMDLIDETTSANMPKKDARH